MQEETLKALQETHGWKLFSAYVRGEIQKLDTLGDITYNDDRAVAIEVRSRQIATGVLREILKPYVSFEDNSDIAQAITLQESGI